MTLPPHWRRRAVWLVVGGLLIGGVVWYVTPPPGPRIKPGVQTTRVLGPVDAEGYVDFLAAINEHLGKDVPPEDNAAIPLLYALGPSDGDATHVNLVLAELGQPPWRPGNHVFVTTDQFLKSKFGADSRYDKFEEHLEQTELNPWNASQFPYAAELLALNAHALDDISQGVRRTGFYRPGVRCSPEQRLIGLLPYELHAIQDVVRQLRMRVMHSLSTGQLDPAREDLLTIHRICRHISHGASSVETFASYFREDSALAAANHWALHPMQSANSLQVYQDAYRQLRPLASIASIHDVVERYMRLNDLQLICRKQLSIAYLFSAACTDESFDPERVQLDMDEFHWYLAAIEINDYFDALVSLGTLARSDRLLAISRESRKFRDYPDLTMPEWESRELNSKNSALFAKRLGRCVAETFMSPANEIYAVADEIFLRQQLFAVFLSLVQYRLEHRSYPDSLETLVPRWLPEVPTDVYADVPVLYRRISDTEMRVYSVGENGIDDGGEPYDHRQGHDDITFSDPPQR